MVLVFRWCCFRWAVWSPIGAGQAYRMGARGCKMAAAGFFSFLVRLNVWILFVLNLDFFFVVLMFQWPCEEIASNEWKLTFFRSMWCLYVAVVGLLTQLGKQQRKILTFVMILLVTFLAVYFGSAWGSTWFFVWIRSAMSIMIAWYNVCVLGPCLESSYWLLWATDSKLERVVVAMKAWSRGIISDETLLKNKNWVKGIQLELIVTSWQKLPLAGFQHVIV